MNALTLFLLAVSLSMDAFAVSVCGGLKMSGRKRLKGGVVFGLWFGGFQALMPFWDMNWEATLPGQRRPIPTGSSSRSWLTSAGT